MRMPGPAVDPHDLAVILGGVPDLGDVAHVDRYALTRHHHEVPDVLQVAELALTADQIGQVALVDLAERRVLVLGAEEGDDPLDGQVERGNLLLRQLHADLPPQPAVDGDRGHARHALEPRREVVLGQLAEHHAVEVPLDADAHDRHRIGVELEELRRIGLLRQAAARPVDAVAHVVLRLAQVRAPDEVQRHPARPFRGRGLQPFEARDGADGLLDRPRDELFDLEGADPGILHAYGETRVLDVRHQIDRQTRERHDAQQDDDGHDHEHRDRPVDCQTWDAHRVPSGRDSR
jgi:hypothetical protein